MVISDIVLKAKDVISNQGQVLFLSYRGSIAHGCYVPNTDPNSIDDIDLMGVVIPDLNTYLGLKEWGSRGTMEFKEGQVDLVMYESRKFFRLLGQGNPNVLSMLWLPEEHVIAKTYWDKIVENRHIFVGKHIYNSFIGYAHDQLDKMTKVACEGYMGAKRKKIVEKFGYDCKNAAHCIRLIRMCIDFLETGNMLVDRQKAGDAQELLDIKLGKWSMDRVTREAKQLFEQAYSVFEDCRFPKEPDWEAINKLCVDINLQALGLERRLLHGTERL